MRDGRGNSQLELRQDLRHLRQLRPGRGIVFTRAPLSVGTTLLWRTAVVFLLFAFTTLIFYLSRDGLRDAADGAISFSDAIYFTLVTVTTVGYGDIVPVSDGARMIDAILVTPIRIVVWFIFVGTAYQLMFQRVLEDWKMKRLQSRLSNHIVICGYGNSGRSAVNELLSEGTPSEQIVVIERDERAVQAAVDCGVVALHGNATGEQMLRVAGVDRARGLIVAVGGDDTALMIVVTARAIPSKTRIIASVHERENVKVLRNAGADVTITPWTFSGYLLADAIQQEHTVDLIQDALSHHGQLRLREREPLPGEVGQLARELPRALLYGVVRAGRRVMFWEEPALRIQEGDRLIVVDVLSTNH